MKVKVNLRSLWGDIYDFSLQVCVFIVYVLITLESGRIHIIIVVASLSQIQYLDQY